MFLSDKLKKFDVSLLGSSSKDLVGLDPSTTLALRTGNVFNSVVFKNTSFLNFRSSKVFLLYMIKFQALGLRNLYTKVDNHVVPLYKKGFWSSQASGFFFRYSTVGMALWRCLVYRNNFKPNLFLKYSVLSNKIKFRNKSVVFFDGFFIGRFVSKRRFSLSITGLYSLFLIYRYEKKLLMGSRYLQLGLSNVHFFYNRLFFKYLRRFFYICFFKRLLDGFVYDTGMHLNGPKRYSYGLGYKSGNRVWFRALRHKYYKTYRRPFFLGKIEPFNKCNYSNFFFAKRGWDFVFKMSLASLFSRAQIFSNVLYVRFPSLLVCDYISNVKTVISNKYKLGRIYISQSRHNMYLTLVNPFGSVVGCVSSGSLGISGPAKRTDLTNVLLGRALGKLCLRRGYLCILLLLKGGPTKRLRSCLRGIYLNKVFFYGIYSVGNLWFSTHRIRKKRRK